MISPGVLVAAEGLDDASLGVVVDYSSEPPVVTDGPYGETKELFGGYWILDVASKGEAVEWAKRAPMSGPGMKAEIRRVTSIDELPQDNEWIQKAGPTRRGARSTAPYSSAGTSASAAYSSASSPRWADGSTRLATHVRPVARKG